jgi:hypothetical protein
MGSNGPRSQLASVLLAGNRHGGAAHMCVTHPVDTLKYGPTQLKEQSSCTPVRNCCALHWLRLCLPPYSLSIGKQDERTPASQSGGAPTNIAILYLSLGLCRGAAPRLLGPCSASPSIRCTPAFKERSGWSFSEFKEFQEHSVQRRLAHIPNSPGHLLPAQSQPNRCWTLLIRRKGTLRATHPAR